MTQADELCIFLELAQMTCSHEGAHGEYEQAVLLNIWTPSSFLLLEKKVEARLGRLEQQGKEGDNPQV
jgi:hypothetical protein